MGPKQLNCQLLDLKNNPPNKTKKKQKETKTKKENKKRKQKKRLVRDQPVAVHKATAPDLGRTQKQIFFIFFTLKLKLK